MTFDEFHDLGNAAIAGAVAGAALGLPWQMVFTIAVLNAILTSTRTA